MTWKPTRSQRYSISIAAGGGMSHTDIAAAFGVARNTLEKYCAAELSTGAQKRRAEVMQAMFRAAKDGNVAAQKAYMILTKSTGDDLPAPKQPRVPAQGKKEKTQAAALTAQRGTEWDGLLDHPVQ